MTCAENRSNGKKMINSIKDIFRKALAGSLAVFLLGLIVFFTSQPVYSQTKKSQQKTLPGNNSKKLSGIAYVDPIAASVKETISRIKKSDRLVKLMATPRSKKSTRDLIIEKKLRVKVVFGIPAKKKLSVRYKQDQKKEKFAKASIAPAIKKLNPPTTASSLKQPAGKTTVNKLKKAPSSSAKNSKLATNSNSSKLSSPSQKKQKSAPKAVKKSGSIGFNHLTTGFLLTGAHFQVRCDRCHVAGVFKGTPRRCFSCHVRGGMVASTPKSSNHIRTDNLCSNCHTTQTWTTIRVDHASVLGTCSRCHNGSIATGKNSSHIASSNSCETCHNTQRWSAARFDHSSITGTCFSCHNRQNHCNWEERDAYPECEHL